MKNEPHKGSRLAIEVSTLLNKELTLEMRNKSSLGGIFLYAISVVFIVYLSLRGNNTDIQSWTAMLWVILSFSALHAVSRSFYADGREMHLYLQTLVSPQAVILSKIIWNLIITGLLSLLTAASVIFLIDLPEGATQENIVMLLVVIVLGGMGFSAILTLVSAIAARSGNNPGLMAILALPLLIPLIVSLIPLTNQLIDPTEIPDYSFLAMCAAVNVLAIALSYLLFPYLWQD
jgi:heme exporter protein B